MSGFEHVIVLSSLCYTNLLKEIIFYSKSYFKRLNCKPYLDYPLIKLQWNLWKTSENRLYVVIEKIICNQKNNICEHVCKLKTGNNETV